MHIIAQKHKRLLNELGGFYQLIRNLKSGFSRNMDKKFYCVAGKRKLNSPGSRDKQEIKDENVNKVIAQAVRAGLLRRKRKATLLKMNDT